MLPLTRFSLIIKDFMFSNICSNNLVGPFDFSSMGIWHILSKNIYHVSHSVYQFLKKIKREKIEKTKNTPFRQKQPPDFVGLNSLFVNFQKLLAKRQMVGIMKVVYHFRRGEGHI